MVIKLNKLCTFVVACIAITVSFIFAMNSEKTSINTNSAPTVKLPIIMYHHITENAKKSGAYTVTAKEFEDDLEYIKKEGFTPVNVKNLTDYVYAGIPLPQNPIMITFDDGFESFYTIAYPLLKNYNFKAVISVIGSASDKYSNIDDHNINYSNLTWEEIKAMSDSGYIEIQNHTYDLHGNKENSRKGMLAHKSESYDEYRNILTQDLLKLQFLIKEKVGTEADAIAYPFGAYTKSTTEIVKDLGFRCSFTCEERVNLISVGDIDSLFELGRFNRQSGIKSKDFFSEMLKDD